MDHMLFTCTTGHRIIKKISSLKKIISIPEGSRVWCDDGEGFDCIDTPELILSKMKELQGENK